MLQRWLARGVVGSQLLINPEIVVVRQVREILRAVILVITSGAIGAFNKQVIDRTIISTGIVKQTKRSAGVGSCRNRISIFFKVCRQQSRRMNKRCAI